MTDTSEPTAYHTRRSILAGLLATPIAASAVSSLALMAATTGPARAQATTSSLGFKEVTAGVDDRDHIAEGYESNVLIRWGDPVLPGAPAFDPAAQTADKQRQQFGAYNDYLCFIPLVADSARNRRGLLCVNHESVNPELIHAGLNAKNHDEVRQKTTKALVDIELAAVGGSVIEVARQRGRWRVVANSRFNRRIHMDTEMTLTGPAAGHTRMKTAGDPAGTKVLGMFGNCAGGMTPWRTWLSGEENIQNAFVGKLPDTHPEAGNHASFGPNGRFVWGRHYARFDLAREPNEMNRFGWIVEVDPLDPASMPRKHTALGRMKHEGATVVIAKDGRVVVYTGDDERNQCIYRFVSHGRYSRTNRAANMLLLESGTLAVARYDNDGTCTWIPLVHGQGPLTEAANGFKSQADVLIETRRAAKLLGGTPMDRPEDIEISPVTGKIYVALTFNDRRKPEERNKANPRGPNLYGHILEMTPPDGDHTADKFRFEVFLNCGNAASSKDVGNGFHEATSPNGWFVTPDNMVFDSRGRLWVGTDGNDMKSSGRADGVWAIETEGPLRRYSRHFYRLPTGAEATGPFLTPDEQTLFLSVQHPADDGPSYPPHGRFSSFDDPSTRWPDFKPGMPPRSSVVVITKKGGGRIGT